MNGLPVPASLGLSAILLLSSAVILVTGHSSAQAARVVTPFGAETGRAPDAAVQPVKEAAPPADDTGRNERDRDGQTMTPLDQSNDPKDVTVTRKIRQALMADTALSTTAQNIKIITVHGKVILRGPVTSLREKRNIAKMAQKFTTQRVLNELEVAAQ